jgi:hypothetical protein
MRRIFVVFALIFSVAAHAGFDGASAPGGGQTGGKWYNPSQGGATSSATPSSAMFVSECVPNLNPCDDCVFIGSRPRGELWDCPAGVVLLCPIE